MSYTMDTDTIIEAFKSLQILVVGDVMLDNYSWGQVERMSPEAPVPIVRIQRTESRLGGAANVALNCKALGAQVSVASVIGNDATGATLTALLNEQQICTDILQKSKDRITTTKTRILSKNQQMIRLDEEQTTPLNIADEHAFIDATMRFIQIQKPDIVIFEDYNKGVLKENVIQKLLAHCKLLKIITAVDPKLQNFFSYQGVTIFKPNLKEVMEGLNLSLPNPLHTEALQQVHEQLYQKLEHHISFITLSEQGVYFQHHNELKLIPSHRRNIADVSGAGDTVIAVAAMVYAVTQSAEAMAIWSNIAGGLVCEEVGVVPVDVVKLASEVQKLQS
jgi:rfaE bifunctional protein kinase chain/domain